MFKILTKNQQEYIANHAKKQREWDLDETINELKQRWDNDRTFYDEEEARKFYSFSSKLKRNTGSGTYYKLLKFQFEICTEILCVKYRWLEENDIGKMSHLRVHRQCYLDIPRKNGKGTIVFLIKTYMFFTNPCKGARYIIVANTKKQAQELFDVILYAIKQNKTLQKHCKITESTKLIYRCETNCKLEVFSNEGKNLDSFPAYAFTLDEIHEYRDKSSYEKLNTSKGVWKEPLCFLTTTACDGEDPDNFEYQWYSKAKKMDSATLEEKQMNEEFYYKVYEAPYKSRDEVIDRVDYDITKDPLMCVEDWCCNPALGNFRNPEEIETEMKNAIQDSSQENNVRHMYYNQHVAKESEQYIDISDFKKCMKYVDLNDYRGYRYWAGMDLSFINDITAYVMVFYDEETNKFICYPLLYTPKETIAKRSKRDGIDYVKYVKNHDLIATKGKYVNFDEMLQNIADLRGKYSLTEEEIAFDRYGAKDFYSKMEQSDSKAIPMSQLITAMSPYVKDFLTLLLDGRLIIHENELLYKMAMSTVIIEDSNGNKKFDKNKSTQKIDGIVALVMGLARARENSQNSYSAIDALDSMDWG